MKYTNESIKYYGGQLSWLLVLLYFLLLCVPQVKADVLPAGYVISNYAHAVYNIGDQSMNVSSNLVETVISPQAVVRLTSSQTQTAAPGTTFYFAHQIVNDGNINDSYQLALTNISGGLSNVQIFSDAAGTGEPGDSTPITQTPVIPVGGTFKFVVKVTVPSDAAIPGSGSFNITATSELDKTVKETNTDKVEYTKNTDISIHKYFSYESLTTGSKVNVNIIVRNLGSKDSGSVTISDFVPSQFSYSDAYVYSSGSTYNDNYGTPKHIFSSGSSADFEYDYGITKPNTATLTVYKIPAGTSYKLRYVIKVLPDAAGIINTKAQVTYKKADGTDVTTDSNTATINFSDPQAHAGVTLNADGADNGVLTLKGPFYSGGVMIFDNYLTNTGTGDDIFDLTTENSNFPEGTTFTFVRADQTTPLIDTDNDGTPDTGVVAPGAREHVYLRVQLPPDSAKTGPFNVTVKATSRNNTTKSASIIDRIAAIAPGVVDLTNTTSGTDEGTQVADNGWGPGPEMVPQVVNSVDPGQTTTFNLVINHRMPMVTDYFLEYSVTSTFTTLGGLPDGWSVQFLNTQKQPITSTTLSGATGGTAVQYSYQAVVTVPEDALPGKHNIYFRVRSPITGAEDTLYDQVNVKAAGSLELRDNNVGQVQPGGIIILSHPLVNTGNTTETSGDFTVQSQNPNWTATAFLDVSGSGIYEPGVDPEFTNLSQIKDGLQPGQTATIFIRVQAPVNAKVGDINTVTSTLDNDKSAATGNNSVTDTVSVFSGAIQLIKTQGLDKNCQSTPTLSTAKITGVNKNECIVYRVTAQNVSSMPIKNIAITDDISYGTAVQGQPSIGGTEATASSGTASIADSGKGGKTVKATWSELAPDKTAYVQYRVKVVQ